jgi:hypothetical protein
MGSEGFPTPRASHRVEASTLDILVRLVYSARPQLNNSVTETLAREAQTLAKRQEF